MGEGERGARARGSSEVIGDRWWCATPSFFSLSLARADAIQTKVLTEQHAPQGRRRRGGRRRDALAHFVFKLNSD